MNTKLTRIAVLSSCALLGGAWMPVSTLGQAQSSQQSVADAARKAREQKQNSQPKATKVVTNDDLKPAAPQTPDAGAQPPAAAQPNAAPQEDTAPADDKGAKAEKAEQLAAVKKQLADAQADLDVLQRELVLQRDTFYANVDYARDAEGKEKLTNLQLQINDKQQIVEELKTKLSALGELVGPPAKPERTPPNAAPQPPSQPSQQNPQ